MAEANAQANDYCICPGVIRRVAQAHNRHTTTIRMHWPLVIWAIEERIAIGTEGRRENDRGNGIDPLIIGQDNRWNLYIE